MKSVKIMFVAVALLITVSAFSEGLGVIPMSARQLGMGGAAIAVADDAFAWTQNPAGLANLASKPKEGAKWSWDVAGSYGESNTINYGPVGEKIKYWDIDFAAGDPAAGMGFGGGWADAKIDPVKVDIYGAGFGMKLRSESCKGLSWGVNVERAKYDADTVGGGSGGKTLFNAGLMYDVPVAEGKAIKLGLVVNDVTDELGVASGIPIGRTWSMGVALPVSDKITLAIDNRGVGEILHIWNAGLEWKSNGWAVRAGDWDGSLTLGAGYKGKNWFVDAAYGAAPVNKILGMVGPGAPKINLSAITVGANF